MFERQSTALFSRQARLALTMCAAILIAVWLFPVAWMIMTSFKASPDITSRVPVFRFRPTFEHYFALLHRGRAYHNHHYGPRQLGRLRARLHGTRGR